MDLEEACMVTSGRNFLYLESATDFDKYKCNSETAPGPNGVETQESIYNTAQNAVIPATAVTARSRFGIYTFQWVWKTNECTVFVLEWKQNHNPLRCIFFIFRKKSSFFVNSNAGGMAVFRPKGFKIDSMRNSIIVLVNLDAILISQSPRCRDSKL